MAALNRRLQLLKEDLERTTERVNTMSQQLEDASSRAEGNEKSRREWEHKSMGQEEQCYQLEAQLKEAQFICEEAERKYDEISRKLAVAEADSERTNQRGEEFEKCVFVVVNGGSEL